MLEKLRTQINAIDLQLLKLLGERRNISNQVGESKIQSKKPIRDPAREEALLLRLLSEGRSLGLDTHYIKQIFAVILEDSVLNQQALLQARLNAPTGESSCRVAFLGGQGSYSYLACIKYFSRRVGNIIEMGCSSFAEITDKVEKGLADYALLPIENTSSGSINEVYDLLQHTSLSIVGELTQPVEHCLMGIKEIDPEQIEIIYTHPQPHAQCSNLIEKMTQVKIEYCDSTSQAFAKVKQLNAPSAVAIGSAEGGKTYGLVAVKAGLANQKQNFSRFIVVSRKPVHVATQVPAKTTIIMTTNQQPGALVDALLVLKNHHINMTKLESRPITGNPWEEMFYLDLQGNIDSDNMRQAFLELEQNAHFIKLLGCYPSEDVVPVRASV